MKKSFLRAGIAVMAGVAVLALVQLASNRADARPPYLPAFTAKYPTVDVSTKKCNVCHGKDDKGEDSKKVRNDYGKAVGKNLGGTNLKKDDPKIAEAIGKAEGEKSAVDGKTFGDLLKAGKLPVE